MFIIFAFSLASVILPVLGLIYFDKGLKKKAFFYLPVGIAFNFAFIGVFASLSYNYLEFGWQKYFIVLTASSAFTFLVLKYTDKRQTPVFKKFYTSKLLAFIAFIAFILIIDHFYIFGKQGWFLNDQTFLNDQAAYFRPPFNHDNERNVIIVNALIRGSGSPFLPETPFNYQLFWYHICALFVSLFAGLINYPLVSGFTLFTGFLFFFILIWALFILRPGLFLRFKTSFILLIIFVTHSDIYSFTASYIFHGKFGIEADASLRYIIMPDGTLKHLFFRNYSNKLTTLSSPQHTIFLMLLIIYLLYAFLWKTKKLKPDYVIPGLLFCLSFAASPVLAVFFFTFYFGYEAISGSRDIKEIIYYLMSITALVLFGMIFYRFVIGLSPVDLFTRPSGEEIKGIFSIPLINFVQLPAILIASLGVTGVIASVIVVYNTWHRKCHAFRDFYFVTLILGGLFFNYLVTNGEIRRHFAILSSFIAIFFIVKMLPSAKVLLKSFYWKTFFIVCFLAVMFMHTYYIHSYTNKPNLVNLSINWQDYFNMNDVIRKKYPDMPVLGAVGGGRLIYPVVMEVASSFAGRYHVNIHSKMSKAQLDNLKQEPELPFDAGKLGLEAIVWGPIEEAEWGDKKSLLKGKKLLETCGSVALYRL